MTKTIGNRRFGTGAYQVDQRNTDTRNGDNAHAVATRHAIGPIVAHRFGRINIEMTINQAVRVRTDVG